MKLSDSIKINRTNRPDERMMDEYARQAVILEALISEAIYYLDKGDTAKIVSGSILHKKFKASLDS